MSEPRLPVRGLARRLLFAVFAVCTCWLIVKNLVLVALLPWREIPVLAAAGRALARNEWLRALPLIFVPIAFGLGWAVAIRPDPPEERRLS